MPFEVNEADIEQLIRDVGDVRQEVSNLFWAAKVEIFCLSLMIISTAIIIGMEAYRMRVKYLKRKQGGC